MTQTLQSVSNYNPFKSHRIEKKNGREYLVTPGVTIVEGVLNKFLVPMEEFGAFVKDWDGVPLVLRHPKQNGGSARVPHPDVPVIGNFYGASLDSQNRRMTGEYWFDKDALLSIEEGREIYQNILDGKMVETSTGYFAHIEEIPGHHKGVSYFGVQRNIHPDHIAVLPDEIGACSIKDGCGINRNSSLYANCEGCPCKQGVHNMTGNLPAEGKAIYEKVYKEARDAGDSEEKAAKKAWGACKKAGWHKKGDEWVKQNYAIYTNEDSGMDYASSSMIAFMLPEEVKADIKERFPFVQDDVLESLHLTMAFLGETEKLDMVKTLWAMFEAASYKGSIEGEVQGLARFISGEDRDAFVLTFDSPHIIKLREALARELDWRGVSIPSEHGFIPHITLAYIDKDEDLPITTFEPFNLTIDRIDLVNGNSTLLSVPLSGMVNNTQAPSLLTRAESWLANIFNQNKEKNPMDKIKELLKQIANSAGWSITFDDQAKSASATLNTAAPLSDELTGLESVVKEMGGIEKFKATMNALVGMPAALAALTETINGLGEGVKQASVMAQNAAQEAETKKSAVVARLIANAQCPLDEATLKGMSLMNLEKLEASYQPTNYAGLGGFVNMTNTAEDDVLGLPSVMAEKE